MDSFIAVYESPYTGLTLAVYRAGVLVDKWYHKTRIAAFIQAERFSALPGGVKEVVDFTC